MGGEQSTNSPQMVFNLSSRQLVGKIVVLDAREFGVHIP